MEIKAQLNNLRISPRKVRLLLSVIKGLGADNAKNQLDHLTKRSAKPLAKLLNSALANAQRNFGLVRGNLFVKEVIINEGPKLKRFRPKGFGSTSPIEKKTSHIKIILAERVVGLKSEPEKKLKEPVEQFIAEPEINQAIKIETDEKKSDLKIERKKEIKKEIGRKGMFSKIGRKFFRRKVI